MTDSSSQELDRLGTEEAAQLSRGIGIGLEPQTRPGTSAKGVVITRSSSWWNHTRCRTCGHTFRRGDRALVVAATWTVQHLVPGLQCGTDPTRGQDPGLIDRDRFATGLLNTWPTSAPISRLAADDWRIPRPGKPTPPACLYCGHSFRAGEYVIICPCGPERPACAAAVHRDPAAGLPCWDRWRPEGKLTICPTTLARI